MKWTIMFNDTYDRKNAASFIELMSNKDPWIHDWFGEIRKIRIKKCWTLKNLKSFKDKTDWIYITMEGSEKQQEALYDWFKWQNEHDTLNKNEEVDPIEDLLPF